MKTQDLFKSPPPDFPIDNEQLISQVKAMPCLYDLNADEYKNKQLKASTWHIIAANIAGPKWEELRQIDRIKLEKDVQRRWKSLRDAFARNNKVNSDPLTDFTNSKKKPYVYAKQMNFLLNFIKTRCPTSALYHDASSMHMIEDTEDHQIMDEKDEVIHVAVNEDNAVLQTISSVSCNDSPTILRFSKRLSEDTEREVVKTSTPRSMEVSTENYYNDKNDPDRMFLLSLLPYFEKLRPSDKLDVQIQFMQILKAHVDSS